MKIDVYQQQGVSEKAQHNPMQLGKGVDWSGLTGVFNNLAKEGMNYYIDTDKAKAVHLNAEAQIEARQQFQDYMSKATVDNPQETFKHQEAIYHQIRDQKLSQLKTGVAKQNFNEYFTRSVEIPYMNYTINYMGELQKQAYKQELADTFEGIAATYLTGQNTIPLEETVTSLNKIAEEIGNKYGIPADVVKNQINNNTVVLTRAWATGLTQTNPDLVINAMAGSPNDFAQFQAEHELKTGEPLTVEKFLSNPELIKAYNEEFSTAKELRYISYLPTLERIGLWQSALSRKALLAKEREKQTKTKLDIEDKEITEHSNAVKAAIEVNGVAPPSLAGAAKEIDIEEAYNTVFPNFDVNKPGFLFNIGKPGVSWEILDKGVDLTKTYKQVYSTFTKTRNRNYIKNQNLSILVSNEEYVSKENRIYCPTADLLRTDCSLSLAALK